MSYLKTKKSRLKTKYSNILLKDFGIKIADSPTKLVVICNGGLSNGITYEMVCDVFTKFENFESPIMVPGKSYSFVKFYDDVNAEKAFNTLNGIQLWPQIKGQIFLCYVEEFDMNLLEQTRIFQNPPGLILIEDFITNEEEKFILDIIGFEDIDKNSSQLKHRKVKHYGYEFKYSTNRVDLNDPIQEIPQKLNFLWERLKKYSKDYKQDINQSPDQLTINIYEPGQGIPPHVDTHSAFEDGIVSLSLMSSIVMEFRNEMGKCYNVFLPKRSLCLILGESRYDWTHGITPRKSDLVPNKVGSLTVQNREKRVSLTFRKTRSKECTCNYPRLCDTVAKAMKSKHIVSDMRNISLEKKAAFELEDSYVHEVYNKIALHFSETRHKPWPNVDKFFKSFPTGSVLVDVGCGNGKYFSKQSKTFEIGCDSNNSLVQLCKQQQFECFSCNCLNIPIRDGTIDGCICIAVIHHLSTEERRIQAVEEIIRILRSKGKALIYVWAKSQEVAGKKSCYLKKGKKESYEQKLVSLNNLQEDIVLPVHTNRTDFGHNDLLVPWKLKGAGINSQDSSQMPVYFRFYHVYQNNELKDMCEKLKNVKVLDYYYDEGNWCILLEKQ